MKRSKPMVVLALALLTASLPCLAAEHSANSPAELARICRTIQPGDTVVLTDGTYTDRHFTFTGKGTKEHPIKLRAETPGKTILDGTSTLSIGGEYLVVDGLLFRGGALESGSIIEFRAKNSPATQDCVLRNTSIIDYNPPNIETRYFWVSLYGTGNTVEHCAFSGQSHAGVTVCVWLDGDRPASHVIRRNYFTNRKRCQS